MWPLLTVIIALVETATSRTENLNFKNGQNSPPLRFNGMNLNMNELIGRTDQLDQLEKFDSFNALDSSDDVNPSNPVKYQNMDEPFKKLSILEELTGNQLDGSADERIPAIEQEDDTDLGQLSAFLIQLLQEPGNWEAPLVLVDEPIPWDGAGVIENSLDGLETIPTPLKRSRYYRRYPWKRQNSRSRYDYDSSKYLCTPTREDVFQLLVALHDARQGNKSRTVNFCNRKRPAGAVFTNIRFLGRRK